MAKFFKPSTKKQINKKHQVMQINSLDHKGTGIGMLNGKVCFVDGVLPDEEVLVQLQQEKKQYAIASLIKVLQPSKLRKEFSCGDYAKCGGCNFQQTDYQAQLNIKIDGLTRLFKHQLDFSADLDSVLVDREFGYRRCARLSFYRNKLGFRGRNSNNIVEIENCLILEPELNQLLQPLKSCLESFKASDVIGHVELIKASNTNVLMLRNIKKLSVTDNTLISDFAKKHNLTLFLAPQPNEVNLICGEVPYYNIKTFDNEYKLEFSPINFIQINENLNQQMIKQALEWLDITTEDRVLDLFAGIGNFSIPLADKAKNVVGVEGVKEMVEQAQKNAQLNKLDNLTFYHTDLSNDFTKQPWAKKSFNKILLDPARAGAAFAIPYIIKLAPSKILYVACNPATLVRDAKELQKSGYKLERLSLIDMFPQTGHIESMALFTI